MFVSPNQTDVVTRLADRAWVCRFTLVCSDEPTNPSGVRGVGIPGSPNAVHGLQARVRLHQPACNRGAHTVSAGLLCPLVRRFRSGARPGSSDQSEGQALSALVPDCAPDREGVGSGASPRAVGLGCPFEFGFARREGFEPPTF